MTDWDSQTAVQLNSGYGVCVIADLRALGARSHVMAGGGISRIRIALIMISVSRGK